jgi:hypothetical protein
MAKSTKDRLREYFLSHVGEILTSDELRRIADTSEWARRVRELRNEERFRILTHHARSDLKMGEYLLEDAVPVPAFSREISKNLLAYVLDRNGYTCKMCGAAAGEPHPCDQDRKTHLNIGHNRQNPWWLRRSFHPSGHLQRLQRSGG